jgi:hypothetical protein
MPPVSDRRTVFAESVIAPDTSASASQYPAGLYAIPWKAAKRRWHERRLALNGADFAKLTHCEVFAAQTLWIVST